MKIKLIVLVLLGWVIFGMVPQPPCAVLLNETGMTGAYIEY